MDNNVDQNTSKGGRTVVVIVVGVIGVALGFGAAKLIAQTEPTVTSTPAPSAPTPDTTTKSADLRATLVALGTTHMNLTNQAINSALDGKADAAVLKAALTANGTEISAAIGSVYGQATQDEFQKIWNVHLNALGNYATAAKAKKEADKTAALNDIATNYTKPISALLAGANPNLPLATLESAFGDHVAMTAKVIDDHVAGNYTLEVTDQAAAAKHIQSLMSTLASAIVKQYPEKF